MRILSFALAFLIMVWVQGCGSLGGSRGTGDSLETGNQRTYAADYDRTFHAVLEAIERYDTDSTNLVRYDAGHILSKVSKGTVTITATVTRIDERNTQVDLLFQKEEGFWRERYGEQAAERLFRKIDTILSPPEPEIETTDIEAVPATQVSEKPDDVREAEAVKRKKELISRLKQTMHLEDDDGQFLERLSNKDLAILDTTFQGLASLAEENKDRAKRCSACYVDLARFYHDAEQYARSAEALKIAIENDPDNAVAHCNLGEIYKHLRLFQDAIRELEEAKRLNPALPDIYINLGIIYDDYVVDDQEALRNYKKYLELGGTDKQVLNWIGQIEGERP